MDVVGPQPHLYSEAERQAKKEEERRVAEEAEKERSAAEAQRRAVAKVAEEEKRVAKAAAAKEAREARAKVLAAKAKEAREREASLALASKVKAAKEAKFMTKAATEEPEEVYILLTPGQAKAKAREARTEPDQAKVKARFVAKGEESEARTKLRESIMTHAAKISGFFEAWDVDGGGLVDRPEFRRGVRASGLSDGSDAEIDAIFGVFDVDGSGSISRFELETRMRKDAGLIAEQRHAIRRAGGGRKGPSRE